MIRLIMCEGMLTVNKNSIQQSCVYTVLYCFTVGTLHYLCYNYRRFQKQEVM